MNGDISHASQTIREQLAARDVPVQRILMVCLGNICRSPSAEGVLHAALAHHWLGKCIELDSCGTSDWHMGEPPDRRAIVHAAKRGHDISGLRARQLAVSDFSDFDLILVMDDANLANVTALAPADSPALICRLLDFLPSPLPALAEGSREVPDPYIGGADAFERVLDLIDSACAELILLLASQGQSHSGHAPRGQM
ncbi:low molecular weight protein-tyrosine-phosphatase [Cobetia sp. QF-1]|uniref:low molecular weight protein-tyrosine-phosphatase n=1 Tax=Cobetia sp. QF-1 TaxID=1969833 RepID=UPI000B53BDFC|nr:low molecular weight protein-tyrosine-phosphatase [Cobetia sp. QF-1]